MTELDPRIVSSTEVTRTKYVQDSEISDEASTNRVVTNTRMKNPDTSRTWRRREQAAWPVAPRDGARGTKLVPNMRHCVEAAKMARGTALARLGRHRQAVSGLLSPTKRIGARRRGDFVGRLQSPAGGSLDALSCSLRFGTVHIY